MFTNTTKILFYVMIITVLASALVGRTQEVRTVKSNQFVSAHSTQMAVNSTDIDEDAASEITAQYAASENEIIVPLNYEAQTEPEPDPYSIETEIITIDGYEVTSLGVFEIRAYCLCIECCQHYSWEYRANKKNPYFVQLTASGTVPTVGRTIAAPPEIPFGTRIYISDLGWRIVEDRGSAIQGNVLDVLKPCHQTALRWGIRNRETFAGTIEQTTERSVEHEQEEIQMGRMGL